MAHISDECMKLAYTGMKLANYSLLQLHRREEINYNIVIAFLLVSRLMHVFNKYNTSLLFEHSFIKHTQDRVPFCVKKKSLGMKQTVQPEKTERSEEKAKKKLPRLKEKLKQKQKLYRERSLSYVRRPSMQRQSRGNLTKHLETRSPCARSRATTLLGI